MTGGAGFVGSNLALLMVERRGSELALPRLRASGVEYVHGDIRSPADPDELPAADLMIEFSAESSVHAGCAGSNRGVRSEVLFSYVNCQRRVPKDYLLRALGDWG
jgi:CDP-paratose 2-epimerase